MNKDNSKVPMAILFCFLIAFWVQGALKLCGVFIFEKALDWEIFKIIDNSAVLEAIFYSLIVSLNVYCLSFALTSKPYSNKWYHYVLIIFISFGATIFRNFATYSYQTDMIIDIFIYIIVPFIVNITSDKDRLLFKKNLFSIILTLSINVSLYFCYLGLVFWSNLLASILLIEPIFLSSSTNFLIRFEVYIGLIAFMLSMNMLIKYVKRIIKMNRPIDIANDEAIEKELEELSEKNK